MTHSIAGNPFVAFRSASRHHCNMPPAMFRPTHEARRLAQIAANVSGANDTAAIEVLQSEELLGIGLGSDILVVDDDPDNLTAYEAALSPLGRRVVAASSGVHALA